MSDTHGFVDPRILEVVDTCDIALHVGDIGGGNVLEALRQCGAAVRAIRGNNDTPEKWPPHYHSTLEQLSDSLVLALPGGTLVALHGDRVLPAARRHQQLRRLFPDARAVVYGHTHRLVCDHDGIPWILNPGAAGRVRTFGGPSCLVLDAEVGSWRLRAIRYN